MDKLRSRPTSHSNTTIYRVIRILLFGYLSIAVLAYLFSDRLIFQPPPSSYQDSPQIIKIPTPDGTTISAIHLAHTNPTMSLLYSHGNSEDMGDIRPLLDAWAKHGFSVFAYDYSGYGTSEGKPSESQVYQDIQTAYTYMVDELGIAPQNIIALGRSLGCGPTLQLATTHAVGGLILESPFISAYRVATKLPLIPLDKFRNAAKIQQVNCPVLVIHGKRDEIIPLWHGQAVFEKANQPKLSLWVKGAGHFDLMRKAGPQYWEMISRFLAVVE